VSFSEKIESFSSIYLDTAPVIYFVEGHQEFGPLVKTVMETGKKGQVELISSVVTLTEVLPRPVQMNSWKLVNQLVDFLRSGDLIHLVEITPDVAQQAGILRGSYPFLRTLDAVQIAASLEVGADAFLTNDKKLRKVTAGVEIIVLADYVYSK